jgi:hypothetical protein
LEIKTWQARGQEHQPKLENKKKVLKNPLKPKCVFWSIKLSLAEEKSQ